jgi:hypothetical protein
MTEFFEGMDAYLKTLWIIAAVASPILLLQLVATVLGMDSGDGGMDVDMDTDVDMDDADGSGSPFQFLTFRNFIIFFTMFAWTGIVCRDNGLSNGWSSAIATAVGLFMMFVVSSMFFLMAKLQVDNTPQLKSAIGKTAKVYLTIPEKGTGKITVSIGGATREVNARSKNGKAFKSGESVKVIEMDDSEFIVDEIQ